MAMDFGGALDHLMNGGSVYRENKGEDTFLTLLDPGPNSQMTEPYIYVTYSDNSVVPWCPRHGDILATDWKKK
jgi:hypothetical protein